MTFWFWFLFKEVVPWSSFVDPDNVTFTRPLKSPNSIPSFSQWGNRSRKGKKICLPPHQHLSQSSPGGPLEACASFCPHCQYPPSKSLPCGSQTMPMIMPKSVNQEHVFFFEICCGSAGRPLKPLVIQLAQSLAHSNPETYVVSNNSHKFYEIMCS